MQAITFSKLKDEKEYAEVRVFLTELHRLNVKERYNWPVARLDYCRWHVFANCLEQDFLNQILVWRNEEGKIVALANAEGPGNCHISIHPDYYDWELIHAILDKSEKNLYREIPEIGRKICFWVQNTDDMVLKAFEFQAYNRINNIQEIIFKHNLEGDFSAKDLDPEFQIKSMADGVSLESRSLAGWRVFHPNEAEENYTRWEWYNNVQKCPLFEAELDLVVTDFLNNVLTFCTVWYDPETQTGYLEPVGTVPEFRRKGLATVLINKALQMIKNKGAEVVYVSSGCEAVAKLYRSAGFRNEKILEPYALLLD